MKTIIKLSVSDADSDADSTLKSYARFFGVACVVCLAFFATACGSDEDDGSEESSSEISDTDTSDISEADGMSVYSAAENFGATAYADVFNPDGVPLGYASFTQGNTGVLIKLDVTGLTPGPHGIHLHTVGECAPDFSAAGGHINPNAGVHGLLNADRTANGQDDGDLPNLYAAADGTARAEFFTTLVTVAGGNVPMLLDADGSTIVIHENPDDHETQPIGGAGGRVACGVIEAS